MNTLFLKLFLQDISEIGKLKLDKKLEININGEVFELMVHGGSSKTNYADHYRSGCSLEYGIEFSIEGTLSNKKEREVKEAKRDVRKKQKEFKDAQRKLSDLMNN